MPDDSKEKRISEALRKVLQFLKNFVSHNLLLKIVSVLIAILLWNYVISTDSSITRIKTVNNLTGYISGQTTLNTTYGLALADDPSDLLSGISVVVEVSSSEFARVNADSLQVMLDLTGVRTAGTQNVSLKAITNYGHVQRIIPESLTLEFEAIDSRNVPVNVQLADQDETLWYNIARSNPAVITVKGAASVVQSISSAQVSLSAEGRSATFTQAAPFTLLNGDGEEISAGMLERSASSVSVSVEVYPTKSIPISTDLDGVIIGVPEEGYYVESVSMLPASIQVAAEQDLLDDVSILHVEPIDVSGAYQSFNTRAKVSTLSSFRFVSAEEVYVTVSIAETEVEEVLENVPLQLLNQNTALQYDPEQAQATVIVRGAKENVEAFLAGTTDILYLDLDGVEPGTWNLPVGINDSAYPELQFEVSPSQVKITVSDDE